MSIHYPLKFTLEDGIYVSVTKTGTDTYEFALTTKEGITRYFTFIDDERSKDEKIEALDFDQLNAVRAFWLKEHSVI